MGKPRWKRLVAIGCSHGNLASKPRLREVLAFCRSFRPHIKVHLGDVIDTAAFRRGAVGTKDECEDVGLDHGEGLEFLRSYEPNVITWGNHDWRLVEYLNDPKAIVRYAASELWRQLTEAANKLHATTTDYEIKKNFIRIGGHQFGHGFSFNENALRDTAEQVGPCVMAHIHKPEITQGRTVAWSQSFCVGYLGEWAKFGYAHRRKASLKWGHGVVFGEVSDTESRLWLASSQDGKPIVFPPGM